MCNKGFGFALKHSYKPLKPGSASQDATPMILWWKGKEHFVRKLRANHANILHYHSSAIPFALHALPKV